MRAISLVLLLAACGAPSSTVVPANPISEERSTTPSVSTIFEAYIASRPDIGRRVGLHAFDGKIADYSPEGLARRRQSLEGWRAELDTIDTTKLEPDAKLDFELVRAAVAQDLFWLVDARRAEQRPLFYDELFAVDGYLTREYAPLDTRVAALIAHIEAALTQTKYITTNLKGPLPEAFVKTDLGIYKGFAEYLRGDVLTMIAAASPALKQKATERAEALAKEAERVAAHLEKVELPRADQGFALGEARTAKLFLAQESIQKPIDALLEEAEKNLAENKAAYEKLAISTTASRPDKAAYLDEARKLTEAARRYLVDKKLVTFPSQGLLRIEETPPFMRWNSAFLNGPGPFEDEKLPAFYYITLPDPIWPAQEQNDYLMTRGELFSTSVHEVYPGHFIQSLWQRRAPTKIQRVLDSYSFVEGWAHYTEQMMVEEGFYADSPQMHLGQLKDALLRNCRFVVSLGLHARGMTIAQAEARFVDDCKQDRATARQQAARGTFDPGYFAYTVGKLEILALRKEVKEKLGTGFSLQRFHDAVLSHGAPNVPLLRPRVLRDLGLPE